MKVFHICFQINDKYINQYLLSYSVKKNYLRPLNIEEPELLFLLGV